MYTIGNNCDLRFRADELPALVICAHEICNGNPLGSGRIITIYNTGLELWGSIQNDLTIDKNEKGKLKIISVDSMEG